MKSSRKFRHAAALLCALSLGVALQFTGCSAPSTNAVKAPPHISSYIIPSTIDTFNIGRIHNMELYYIFTHYDTVKYASYPNKYSQTGIDSLAALFIMDSLQGSVGPLSPAEINADTIAFDEGYTQPTPTHSTLVATIDSTEAQGFIASDEANFIITADSDLWLCTSYSQENDTISSLISHWNATVWAPSTSHGVEAYEFLSIASHSSAFWGQSGDTILPIAAHQPPTDADGAAYGYKLGSSPTAPPGSNPANLAAEYSAAYSALNGTGPAGTGNNNGNGGGGGGGGNNNKGLTGLIVMILLLSVAGLL